MTSNNGIIPAGNVAFNPFSKDNKEGAEYTLPLDKCPDRSAQITFHQSFQLLRKNIQEEGSRPLNSEKNSRIGRTDRKLPSSNNSIQG